MLVLRRHPADNATLIHPTRAEGCIDVKGTKEMPKNKSDFQNAAGKLISAIQKEWCGELGNPNAEFSENVMDAAHDLLQAGSAENAKNLLGSKSVRQFLGDVWVQAHPSVKPVILVLENTIGHPEQKEKSGVSST